MHGTPLFLFSPYRPSSSDCTNGAIRKKTAEERFNMLARGWLAYPVTPIHAHLPPKSGCRSHIPRPANNLYNRSSAVDPLRHNQPQVGKPTWGYDYTTALRRLPLPSAVIPKNALTHRPTSPKTPSAHRPPSPKTTSAHRPPSPKPAHHQWFAPTAQCGKNRRRAVSYVSTGLACLPRDINPFASTAEERLYKPHLSICHFGII